jgi:hypothetical protein
LVGPGDSRLREIDEANIALRRKNRYCLHKYAPRPRRASLALRLPMALSCHRLWIVSLQRKIGQASTFASESRRSLHQPQGGISRLLQNRGTIFSNHRVEVL